MGFNELWKNRPWIKCPDYGNPKDQSGLFAAEYIYEEMSKEINSLQKQLDIAMEALANIRFKADKCFPMSPHIVHEVDEAKRKIEAIEKGE